MSATWRKPLSSKRRENAWEAPPLPSHRPQKQVYKNYFKLTRKNSDLFFCVTSFFFLFLPWERCIEMFVTPAHCIETLPNITKNTSYNPPFGADATFSRSEATLRLVSPADRSQPIALKGFDSLRLGHHETFQFCSRVVMNRSHGRPNSSSSSSRMKIWNTHKGS